MVKRYGGVILLDKVLTMEDNWEIPRSSEKECYDFILEDLKKATEMLPASYGSREKGRATKGAAYALKSRVELYDKRYEDVIKSCAEVYKLGYELVDGTTPENIALSGGLPIKITRKLFSMYNTKARMYTTT